MALALPKKLTWKRVVNKSTNPSQNHRLSPICQFHRCLEQENVPFDIAILGMLFDTAIAYRPG
jgi:hypothetical protein